MEAVFSDAGLVYLPWQSICGFFRVMTNPRLPGGRFSVDEAAAIVDSWLHLPNVRPVGPLGSDAALAALTMELGGVSYTTDRGFARYPGLRWKNPLV